MLYDYVHIICSEKYQPETIYDFELTFCGWINAFLSDILDPYIYRQNTVWYESCQFESYKIMYILYI